jgi:hypothetical protein
MKNILIVHATPELAMGFDGKNFFWIDSPSNFFTATRVMAMACGRVAVAKTSRV